MNPKTPAPAFDAGWLMISKGRYTTPSDYSSLALSLARAMSKIAEDDFDQIRPAALSSGIRPCWRPMTIPGNEQPRPRAQARPESGRTPLQLLSANRHRAAFRFHHSIRSLIPPEIRVGTVLDQVATPRCELLHFREGRGALSCRAGLHPRTRTTTAKPPADTVRLGGFVPYRLAQPRMMCDQPGG